MTEIKQYPKVIVGAFIFNDKNELLLVKSPRWHDKYTNPGGKVEMGEAVLDALRREVKEETGLDISEPEFIAVLDGLKLKKYNTKDYAHLIFVDYKVRADGEVRLNDEHTSYAWRPLSEWLKEDVDEFAPYIYPVLKKLKEMAETEDWEYKCMRATADYRNLMKQTAKEKEEFAKFANAALLSDLLPVYDNLKLSLKHIDEQAEKSGWAEGVRHIAKQFKEAIENAGVKEIPTAGQKFDHNTMEAIDRQPTTDKKKDGYVVREVKAGYILNGKVLSPAGVVVYSIDESE